ncbi:hypothetical protein CYMTET_24041 [Cymbomonas tetramitiformis]|uniref:Vacuolar protein sorting-associated protein 35 n=1 Tax=Cymbomonas tetramitiformis TaxID=36881 RepID=A0AAE0FY14_9CHLO|nr:hypothetical protein CYMTET_24041 [Cymbomonas tetramitiformis]
MSAPEATLSPAEEQQKWLTETTNNVKQHAYYMKQAIDDNNLREALKHTAAMLSELRTSQLSPQKYYALYMKACDELLHLESFFRELHKGGRSIAELYELVQHAGNILPRMYLLITVGSVFVQSKDAPAKDILKDLVEMARGVQHPLRGLFLRAYLAQCTKDKLPDQGSEYEGEGGDVKDAVEFLLQNFTEMNKLWVRMQHQGSPRLKEKREKERQELRDLVGKNLLVLSQLEGVDLEIYQELVLPRVLEQVVNCKDEIGQTYLMDAIIQVFPDDFHLNTLETLNKALGQMQPTVKTGSVLASLMTRLSRYALESPEVIPKFEELQAFSLLREAVKKVSEIQTDVAMLDLVTLYQALMSFVVQVHKASLDKVDEVLAEAATVLAAQNQAVSGKAVTELVALLSAPLSVYDVVPILSLQAYPKVMELLEEPVRKEMAVTIVRSVLKSNTCITDSEKVDTLFGFISLLIKDDGLSEPEDEEEFEEQQCLVSRLVMLLKAPQPKSQLAILNTVRHHFGMGGPLRLKYTLPPLVFAGLRLITQVQKGEDVEEGEKVSRKTIFGFLHQTVQALGSNGQPGLAMRLYLQCAAAANANGFEDIAYEFFTQGFLIYEEEISDSREQVTSLQLFIGTLHLCTCFGQENRDALVHKCTTYSSRLLKKSEQCRAAYSCSHLFWVPGSKDSENVALCLSERRMASTPQMGAQGSATVAAASLWRYLYFFDEGNTAVTVQLLQGLMDLIAEEMAKTQSDDAEGSNQTENFYASTLRHIKHKKAEGGEVGARYAELNV